MGLRFRVDGDELLVLTRDRPRSVMVMKITVEGEDLVTSGGGRICLQLADFMERLKGAIRRSNAIHLHWDDDYDALQG